jgi:hypothetical protein
VYAFSLQAQGGVMALDAQCQESFLLFQYTSASNASLFYDVEVRYDGLVACKWLCMDMA